MIERLNRFLNPTRQRYAWFIGAVIWLSWLVNIIGGSGILDLTGINKGTDFMAYYSAGKIILSDKSADLYSLDLMNSIQHEIFTEAPPGFYPFLYPPQYAIAMVPFSLLPYLVAYSFWVTLGFAFLWLSLKWLGIQKPLHTLLLSLTWFPVFAAVSFGQNSFFSLAILCCTYYLWNKNKNFLAGVIFSLLLFKPQFLVFIAFLWMLDWKKSWKSLAGLSLGVFGQVLLIFLVLPQASNAYIRYAVDTIPNFMFIQGFPIWNSVSIQSFWIALFPNHPTISKLLYAIFVLVVSIFFLLVWKAFKNNRKITFSISIIWLALCIPFIFIYDWTLLLIPAIIFWNQLEGYRPELKVLFSILWIAGLLSSVFAYLQSRLFPISLQIALPSLLFATIFIYRKLISENVSLQENLPKDGK